MRQGCGVGCCVSINVFSNDLFQHLIMFRIISIMTILRASQKRKFSYLSYLVNVMLVWWTQDSDHSTRHCPQHRCYKPTQFKQLVGLIIRQQVVVIGN